MRTFMTLLAKELRESWKTSRLLIVGLLFLVFGLMSPLLAKYTPDLLKALGTQSGGVQISIPPPTVQDTVAQFLKNVGGNGILVALILGVGLVVREKERGTAAFVLTKPVTCGTFLAAKFARLAIELTVGVVLAAIADAYYTALLFRPLDLPGFIACCALLLLGLLSIGGVAFLGSTLMPSTVAAIGFAVGGLGRARRAERPAAHRPVHPRRARCSGPRGGAGTRFGRTGSGAHRQCGGHPGGGARFLGDLPPARADDRRVTLRA